jgi:uncharacterized membrane protein YfcA
VALPALVVGDRIGNALFARYSTAFYRRVAVLILFCMGILILIRAL